MNTLKKTTLACLALTSSAVFAGSMGPVCAVGNVTVPCESTGWDVGLQALYLKPVYNNFLAWAGDNSTLRTFRSADGLTDTVASTDAIVDSDPEWSWGFKLEGSYHFSTGNDVNLNWYHLAPKTTSQVTTNTETTDLALVSQAAPLLSSVASIHTSIRPSWDAVNAEFGQHIDVSEHKKIRFHGGAQFAHIKTLVSNNTTTAEVDVTGLDPLAVVDRIITAQYPETAQFNGFGPRVGADMSYLLGQGLAMYANGAATLLVGKTKYSLARHEVAVQTDPLGVDTFRTSVLTDHISGSGVTLVPELEIKLGLKYTYAVARGDLTFDGGYMWVNYFNAQTVVSTPVVGEVTGSGTDSNFGVNGAYFGIKWVG